MAEFQDETERLRRHRDRLIEDLERGTFSDGRTYNRRFLEHALRCANTLLGEDEPVDYLGDYLFRTNASYRPLAGETMWTIPSTGKSE